MSAKSSVKYLWMKIIFFFSLNLENIVLNGSAKLETYNVDCIQYVRIKSIIANLSLDNDKLNVHIFF